MGHGRCRGVRRAARLSAAGPARPLALHQWPIPAAARPAERGRRESDGCARRSPSDRCASTRRTRSNRTAEAAVLPRRCSSACRCRCWARSSSGAYWADPRRGPRASASLRAIKLWCEGGLSHPSTSSRRSLLPTKRTRPATGDELFPPDQFDAHRGSPVLAPLTTVGRTIAVVSPHRKRRLRADCYASSPFR